MSSQVVSALPQLWLIVFGSDEFQHKKQPVYRLTQVEFLFCRKTLEAFKEGDIDVLIGTDRMARGIHIDGLRYVINYDMPPYVKTYIHRAGRTARAGESGSCFTFLRKHEVMHSLTIISSFPMTIIAMC